MNGKTTDERESEHAELANRMSGIKHKIVVVSGKGGVGKSTVAVNLAFCLNQAGHRVGLLDADVHGPSVPMMLGVQQARAQPSGKGILPVDVVPGFRVISVGFLLESTDEPVIWRGPMKHGVIRQFLKDVEWGELDYPIVDSPPGTGDEPLTVAQSIPDADGAVVVTTPQQVAIADVRRCLSFCRRVHLPVLGVLENMSGFTCPHCSKHVDMFGTGGGRLLAEAVDVPFLGAIPLEQGIVTAGDSGSPFVLACPDTDAARAFQQVVASLAARLDEARREGAS